LTLGNQIANHRTAKGWTQAQLAEFLQMHPNHVSRWEKDHVWPRRKTLERLAELFGITLDELLGTAHQGPVDLTKKDPELAQLMMQAASLGDEQRRALRAVLRSMITCQHLEHLVELGRGA
jgi:transcriptional regulator with XRE-family HTH domain